MDIVVVNHNTREDLHACLTSLQHAGIENTVVVDNASTDGSVEMMYDLFPRIQVVANAANIGYGAAANQGIERGSAEHVLLLNSDTRLVEGSLSGMDAYMAAHPRAAIVGPRLIHSDGTLQKSCFPFPTPFDLYVRERVEDWFLDRFPSLQARSLRRWAHDAPRVVPYVLGAALAIKRTAFQQVGRFSESFFMYFEEVDLCYRMCQAGWQVHFAPIVTLAHLGGSSTSKYQTEMRIRWYESSVEFYRRNYPRHRLAELLLVMRGGLVLRLLRDSIRFSRSRESGDRAYLSQQIVIWKRALAVR